MPKDDGLSPVVEKQLRQACAELDRQVRAGGSCQAEVFLERFPSLASQTEAALELIYTEFVTREELGQEPRAEEYLGRFPQWRQCLEEQFQIHSLLHHGQDRSSDSTVWLTENGASAEETATAVASGSGAEQWIGTYELLEKISQGSMGAVYKARQQGLNRIVALKMVLPGVHAGRAEQARLRTEAEAVARLQHPNIVQIYEVGDAAGRIYLSLEFVNGGSLAEKLAGPPRSARSGAALVETLARAIHYAHEQGIIHRDLKPANILLQANDGQARGFGTPKITDFGLAKLLDRQGSQTDTGTVFGTPSYMAPEQAKAAGREIGPPADIYALGAILYEILTGRPPFRADNLLATMRQVVEDEPVPLDRLQPGVPRDLATICMKCLHKEPRRRYASAEELADDLHRFLAGQPIQARPNGVLERGWKWAHREPTKAALLAVVGAATCALFLGSVWYGARLQLAVEEADRQRLEAHSAAEEADLQRAESRAAAEEADRQRTEARIAADEADRQRAEARNAAAEAERQRKEAERQRDEKLRQVMLYKDQLESTRRSLYTIQLTQVEAVLKSDPSRALELLEDSERCPADLRDFAWGLFYHLGKQDRLVLKAHDGPVREVLFAPDGQTLASAGRHDAIVKLWDAATGKERGQLRGQTGNITALAFSPDGQTLATGGDDKTVRLWDLSERSEFARLQGHKGGITALAFAPSGSALASASKDGTVKLWDVDRQVEILSCKGHTGTVRSVSFALDGQTLATGGDDKTIRLWDVTTGVERARLPRENPEPVVCVRFSPDGKKLAVAEARKPMVSLWDVDTLKQQGYFRGHVDEVHSLAFTLDGRLLATGSEDRTVKLWDVRTGAERFTLKGHTDPVRCLAFSPDGQALVSAGDDESLRYWAVGTRSLNRRPERIDQPATLSASRITALTFAPNKKAIATANHDGSVNLWDPETLAEQATIPAHNGIIWSVAFSGDSRLLATGGEDRSVKVWDATTLRELASFNGHRHRVWSVAFSPDGKLLASGSEDGSTRLFDIAGRKKLVTLPGHGQPVVSVGFSPDGKTLVAGCYDGKVEIWDVASRQKRTTLEGHHKAVLFALFSPDGKTLATGGLDNTVKLWDADTLRERVTLRSSTGYLFSAAFTPDSRTLATGAGSRVGSFLPGEVKLWDVATGHCRATLPGQTGPVAFAQDGRTLATVNRYTEVRLWHSEMGGEVPTGP